MTVPAGLRALRHRDFRVFFAGQAVALVGSWMQQVAQAWLVLSLTNSPLRLGLVGSLNFLPILLFALVGGAVADRLPKRRLLVLTQSLLFCQTATLALLTVRARGTPLPRGGTTIGEEIREGVGYVLHTPRILILLAVLAVISITVFNFSVYVPLFARQVLGLGPEGFGLLMAAVGVGAVGGALTLGALQAPSISLLFTTGFLSCAGLVVMSTIARFGVAALVLFVLGWISVMVVAGCQAALQLAAPDRLRGRIMSLHTFIYGGVFPFGAFTIVSISEHWGVSWAFRVAGLFGLTALTLVLVWWRFRTRQT